MILQLRKTKLKEHWKYVIVIVLAVAAYLPTFTGDFILDDQFLVKENPYIMKLQSISSYFAQEDGIYDEKDLGMYHTGYYRPLINITYFLDYKIWGMKAFGFRVTNLILHLLSCLIIFKLIDHFIGDRKAALWCVALFSIHPVNTEAVSCIVARNNILVTLFSLTSLYFYIVGIERREHVKAFISIIAFACAVFTKEFGIMILPVFFLYNRFLSVKKHSISSEILSYVPYVIIILVYFFLRHMVIGNILTPFDDPQIFKRLYFVPYIIAWNLRLIFLPFGLHQYNITYPSSFYDPYAISSIILILFISSVLWIKRYNKILIFSSISFLSIMFPVLSIIPSAATPSALVSLRWLYFPMFFIILSLGLIIKRALDSQRIMIKTILVLAICYFGIYSYIVNKYHWHDQGAFFTQEVLHFNNMLYAGGFAETLFNKGEKKKAEKYYQIAIKEYPRKAYNYINYSAMLITNRSYNDALLNLKKAKDLLMTHHEQAEWHNNVGMALQGKGDNVEALKHFDRAVSLAPMEAIFWANLGGAYGMAGEYEQSIKALKKGIAISPGLVHLKINLAMSYINLKNYHQAVLTLEKIPKRERRENKKILKLLEMARDKLDP